MIYIYYIYARVIRVTWSPTLRQSPLEISGSQTVTLDNARNRRFDDGGTEGSPRATNFSIRARSSPFSRSLPLTSSHGRACCSSLVHSFSVSRFPSRVLLSSRRCWRKKEGGMGTTATHTSLSRLRTIGVHREFSRVALRFPTHENLLDVLDVIDASNDRR